MSMIDALEPRRMLAASSLRVSSVQADNRGEILVQFSARATGIKGSAIQVYTAGADGKLYTSDDKREDIGFTYSSGKKLLRIVADIKKDTPYRLKLDGKTRIKSESDGTLLDGDFVSASRASGDGVAGGNYEMQVVRDTSNTPIVRMRTNAGTIELRIRGDLAPVSSNAFLTLANKKVFDDIIVTRALSGALIQLGGLKVTGDGSDPSDLAETEGGGFGEELPVRMSNIRGTVSFARNGVTGEAGREIFFNLTNNSQYDTAGGGGPAAFTPFAEVTTSEGYDTIDTIGNKPTGNFTNVFNTDTDGDGVGVSISNLPVLDAATFNADPTFRPFRDGIVVQRTASLSNVVSKNFYA